MKKICLLICSVFIFNLSFSQKQTEEILLTINDKKITKEEFVRIYEKNKTNLSTGEVTSVDEYLDLFINFKLKVFEAEKLGLDTLTSFINEFEGYRKQLARPYLLDNQANDKVIKEAYQRMLYEIRASHILVKLDENALPKDTIEAFEKAVEIRRRVLKGEPFEIVAKGSSDDPSVKNNGGDLGYFTVFQMIYPFENAAYNSKIGEVSNPVRTRFGYHIVKVTDKREARGEVKVAHIMLTVPRGSTPEVENQKKQLINEIYHKVKQGEDFTELAKTYSEDRGSAKNGGELPWFGTGRMVQEFEQASFALTSNGEISQPVRTSFGWHLIKRIDRKEIPSFKEAESEIKRKVGKDKRSDIARNELIKNLKAEYNFSERKQNRPTCYDTIEHIYILKQDYLNPNAQLKDTLFTFLNKVFLQKDYWEYANDTKRNKELTPFQYSNLYNEFVENKILEFEESMLENKYPEYKYLLKEYHDGMLLFEITDQKIWSKAVDDSIGLRNFYEENKNKYMWDERWDGSIYTCSNKEIYNKVAKIINKRSFGEKFTNNDLQKQFNTENVIIESGIYNKGENIIIDNLVWKVKNDNLNTSLILIKGQHLSPAIKSFDDAKGLVISDFQDYLEKEWINNLREQYNIKINNVVLSSVK